MTSNFPKPPPTPEWASRAPGRRPEFKIHNKRQSAYAAAACRYPHKPTYIYKWNTDSEEWILVESFEVKDRCDVCNAGPLRRYELSQLPSDRKKPQHQRRRVCRVCYKSDSDKEIAALKEREELKEYKRLKLKYET
jgi:hypothetical protein